MAPYSSMTHEDLIAELEALQLKFRQFQESVQSTVSADSGETRILLEAVMEHSPCGVLVATNSTGRIIFANNEACRINGVSKEQHLNIDLNSLEQLTWTMHYPDGRPMQLAESPLAKAALHGQAIRSAEIRLKRADGTDCWVLCNGNPLYDQKGDLQSGVVTFVEISDQKKNISEAAQNETAYKRIVGTVIDAYYKADKQGRLILATPTTARILGYKKIEDILGKDIATSFYANPRQRAVFMQELLQKKSLSSYLLQLKKADGSSLVVECTSRLITSSNQDVEGVEGLFRDVTTRVQAEETLRRSEFFYRKLFEHTGTATVLLDSSGLICRVNTQAIELSGYSREELEGKVHWQEVVAPEDLERMTDYNNRRNSPGPQPPSEYDFTMFDSQGNKKFVHARIDFLEDTNERIVSMTDMTSRIRMEKELAALNHNLELLVAERTEALKKKNIELETANKRLLELDAVKSNLLSSVSHELRTPLTSIMGFAKVTKNTFEKSFTDLSEISRTLRPKAETIRNNLEIIAREGKRLTRLINNLLDLSLVESGEFRWCDSRFNMGELLTMAVEAAYGEFQAKPDVAFEVSIPPDLPDVFADRDKLQQVLLNLLNNAAKFTDKGKVAITAEAYGDWVSVSVSDTGVGIPDHLQQHIFEKFYTVRSDDTLHRNVVGTGLGLALCLQVVEHYHGHIGVNSSPGKGSTFILKLPVAG